MAEHPHQSNVDEITVPISLARRVIDAAIAMGAVIDDDELVDEHHLTVAYYYAVGWIVGKAKGDA